MSPRGPALFLAVGLLAGAAAAEEITLRSGDHDSFTRLVLSIGEGSDWSLGRTPSGYALTVAGASAYDSADVFRRISRDRISDLVASSGRLDIATACACHADAFLFRPGSLVVDIIDGPAPEGSEFETALDDPVPAVRPAATPGLLPLLPPDPLRPGQEVAPPVPMVPPPAPSGPDPELARSIDAAAASGFLTLAPDLDPVDPSAEAGPPDGTVPGVAALTALETARREGLSAANTPCPDPEAYDVPAWSVPGEAFLDGLSARRQAGPPEAVQEPAERLALARFLVASGMGREIRPLVGADDPEGAVLLRMAALLEGDPDGGDAAPGWQACAAPVLLWEGAIRQEIGDLRSDQIADVLAAFLLLPPPVAGRIGPGIAAQLATYGHPSDADTILSRLRQSEWTAAGDLARVEALVDLALGTPDRAIRDLDNLRATDDLDARGLADLLQLRLETGQEADPDLLELGDVLLRQSRGAPVAVPLARALALARSAAGDHDGALEVLVQAGEDLDRLAPGLAPEVREDLLLHFAQTSADDDFLDEAFALRPEEETPTVRQAFADRLDALGFPDEAARVGSGVASGPLAAALETADTGPAVGPVATGLPPSAPQLAETAPTTVPPGVGAEAEPDAPPPLPPIGPLGARRIVLEQSGAARSRIEDLLRATPSPLDGADG